MQIFKEAPFSNTHTHTHTFLEPIVCVFGGGGGRGGEGGYVYARKGGCGKGVTVLDGVES